MNEKAEFASQILKRYAYEHQILARSTSDISPLEEWLILQLFYSTKSSPNVVEYKHE